MGRLNGTGRQEGTAPSHHRQRHRPGFIIVIICLVIGPLLCSEASAQLRRDQLSGFTKEELAKAGIMITEDTPGEPGISPFVFGLRAGAAIPTDKVLQNIGNGTSVGPLLNFESLYALQDWIRVGMMLEWHRHTIDFWGPKFGTLNVISILPTVELRPTVEMREAWGLERVIPYGSLGLGVNVHTFSNSDEVPQRGGSFSSTFALRIATGIDIPINSRWAFNTELAWKRDRGTYQLDGQGADFNASVLNLLVGVRAQF